MMFTFPKLPALLGPSTSHADTPAYDARKWWRAAGLFGSGITSCRRGAAAVEFALLTPVFLLMVVGMMAYGIYFGTANSIQQLTADAARIAIAGLNEAERNELVGSFLANNAGEYPLIDQTLVSFTIGDKPGDSTLYRVTVRYDASQLPIWDLYLPLPMPNPVKRTVEAHRLRMMRQVGVRNTAELIAWFFAR